MEDKWRSEHHVKKKLRKGGKAELQFAAICKEVIGVYMFPQFLNKDQWKDVLRYLAEDPSAVLSINHKSPTLTQFLVAIEECLQ